MTMSIGLLASAVAAFATLGRAADNITQAPAQAVLVDPLSFAALGENNTLFRDSSFTSFFNPTNSTPPFFQVFDPSFLTSIIGPNATIRSVASNATFSFAHEAPIWNPETNVVTFASNDGGALGMSDLDHNSKVGMINMTEVESALANSNGTEAVEVTVTELDLPETIQMTNGGTGPFRGNLLLTTSGRGTRPPSVVLVNPSPPHNTTVLLDNYFGRQFNSLNDVKVHPTSGKIFFTDVVYGWLNHFRPMPLLPNQVYMLDPDTRAVKVVADQFDKNNGVAFSGDGKTAYVTDTGSSGGFLGNNQTEVATIYKYDVDPKSGSFSNRRTFAYADTGVPDGIQIDTNGNVFAGCGDGVQVWNDEGTLLGKFFLGTTSANMVFAGPGKLVIMGETAIYLVEGMVSEGLDLASFGA